MPGIRSISGREVRSLLEGMLRDSGSNRQEGRRRFHRHLREALDKGQISPHDFSIRELFEELVPSGREIVRHWTNPKGRSSELLEAGMGSAVGYSDFSGITGQIFFTEILEKYDTPDFIFSKAVESKHSTIQDIEKLPGISRIGKGRDKVKEGDPYKRYGVSEDYIEVAAKVKDGGILEVTKEAVIGDKTGELLDRCGDLGFDLGYGKEERIIDAIIDENDGAASAYAGGHRYTWKQTAYASYQSSTPWINLQAANPLTTDETCVEAAWKLLVAITDPYTGRPILQSITDLICAPDVAWKAARLVSTTEHRTTAPGYSTSGNPTQTVGPPALGKIIGQLGIMSSPILKTRLGTDTSWFIGNVKKAVRHLYNWDVTPVQRGSMTEADFERDIVQQFKASLKDCVAVINPRYLCKSTAA